MDEIDAKLGRSALALALGPARRRAGRVGWKLGVRGCESIRGETVRLPERTSGSDSFAPLW